MNIELLVLSGLGLRFSVPVHDGVGDEWQTFKAAVDAARAKLHAGHARAFVAIRIAAEVVDGTCEGTDRELARFEVYGDRVVLVPDGQGGLTDAQKDRVMELPKIAPMPSRIGLL